MMTSTSPPLSRNRRSLDSHAVAYRSPWLGRSSIIASPSASRPWAASPAGPSARLRTSSKGRRRASGAPRRSSGGRGSCASRFSPFGALDAQAPRAALLPESVADDVRALVVDAHPFGDRIAGALARHREVVVRIKAVPRRDPRDDEPARRRRPLELAQQEADR